jgi:MraZ protein
VFLGEHNHTLDAKGRVVMPSSLRRDLEQGLVTTKGLDRCLVVFTTAGFEAEAARQSRHEWTEQRARDFARTFYGGATDQGLDAHGRLALPPALRAYAGLEHDVVIVGVNDRIEIWDAATYARRQEENDQKFADTDSEGRKSE